NNVLSQNFVEITGQYTFTLHIIHPNSAFPYLLTGSWAYLVAPKYVMEQDLALWNQTSSGYTIPIPNLTGNLTQKITQYFNDEVATCNVGPTPQGCASTYLDTSVGGSLAGTGPYILKSFSTSTNNFVLQANSNYWGAPYQFTGGQKIAPSIQTININ